MAKSKGKTGKPLAIGGKPSGIPKQGKGYPKVRGKGGKAKMGGKGC